jgi:hypothetical protein
MVKFPFKNAINAFLILLAGSSPMTDAKDLTEFNWIATESAPANYPMQIMRGGGFSYHGVDDDGLYIPSGGVLYGGWGNPRSSHVVGPALKPLPDKLDILFYSYLEDTFYRGHFDLPYDKILNLFREGAVLDPTNPIYNRIMVGVAPGGTVAVWVTGRKTVEVFFGKALKTDVDWGKALDYPADERAGFIARRLASATKPDILASIRKNGIPFDRWSGYRAQYHWVPTFKDERLPKYINVIYFNGENNRLNFSLEEKDISQPRPVPSEISFSYLMKGEKEADVFIIHFNEEEIYSAFKKLGSNQDLLRFEFEPKLPKPSTIIRLYNDKESIVLRKSVVETW